MAKRIGKYKVSNKECALSLADGGEITGAVKSKYVKHVAVVTGVDCNETAGDSPNIGTFTQPANTIIENVMILCTTAPTITSGDIGYEIGTSSSGAQVVAAQTDEILDAGTTVVLGAITHPSLAAGQTATDDDVVYNGFVTITQDTTAHAVSVLYTASERSIYCNITNSQDAGAGTGGAFSFIFEYLQFA